MKDVHFSKPKQKNEPEQVMSTRVSPSAIETSLDVVKTDYSKVFEAAKILRREIGTMERWKFRRRFDDFIIPNFVKLFCKTFIMGVRKIKTEDRDSKINNSSCVLGQLMI